MESGSSPNRTESGVFWSLVLGIVAADIVTKLIAVTLLVPRQIPREVVGDWVRLTLVFNRGAAFGLHLGPYSREIFLVLTLVALAVLWRLFRSTCPGDWLRIVALGMVCGGAIGNLIDRIRSPLGVVDFLDIGVHDWRWPTFNVADIAVSTGACLLALALWSEDRAAAASATAAAAVVEPPAEQKV
ncbi:MAG: signal peptidase II [Gemmatimonadaceae bacterium]